MCSNFRIEEQQLELSFGEEYSMFSLTGDYASVDTSRFDHRLNIEDVYSEIVSPATTTSNPIYAIPEKFNGKWIKSEEDFNSPEYSVIDLSKKYEERMKKQKQNKEDDDKNISAMISNLNIYEDIQFSKEINQVDKDENIYEPV
jgi:hypothetical protein